MVIGATLPLFGLGYLVLVEGLAPLAYTQGGGYPEEEWRTLVLVTVLGGIMTCLGVAAQPTQDAQEET